MNVFDRLEARRALLRSSIAPMWVTFRSAIDELVSSYNNIEEGLKFPAKIDPSGDRSIVVYSERGMASDQFHSLTICIQLSLNSDKLEIHGKAEEWHMYQGSRRGGECFLNLHFTLNGDPQTKSTWLENNGKKYSAIEAAEVMLWKALFYTPGEHTPDPPNYQISPI